jgi:DNA-binding NarL/FixJ family response regulator
LVGHAPDVTSALGDPIALQANILLLGQPPKVKSLLPLLGQIQEVGYRGRVVLWVSDLSDMDATRAMQSGAKGLLRRTHPIPFLYECFRTVGAGGRWLESNRRGLPAARRGLPIRITSREREIIEYICLGLKNREIAQAMNITAGTVKVHLMHIFEKTGVKDRFQLALHGPQLITGVEPSPNGSVSPALEI